MPAEERRKIVLASGAFDLLHYGHVYYLERAKKAGGQNAKLIVIVARDRTVERLKGARPVFPEEQRRALVESLRVVDEAVLGYEDLDMLKVMEKVKPDIIALGYDEEKAEAELRRLIAEKNLDVQVARVSRFEEEDLASSSKIKRKIIEKYRRSNS